jgi:hypothetical protein
MFAFLQVSVFASTFLGQPEFKENNLMQTWLKLLIAGPVLLLAGCATYTQGKSREVAIAECEKLGKRFLEIETIDKGGAFGVAGVRGECVDADDPRLRGAT